MDSYSIIERELILKTVNDSIRSGLKNSQELILDLENFPKKLREPGACFVTINLNGKLRGCVGSLVAYQPLIKDIAQNAYSASFLDPRFSPLTEDEYPDISKHVSILSKPTPIEFSSEDDLINKLKPNIDGVILTEKNHRGTFLPSVWETLTEPRVFLKHLKLKAGLTENYWSDSIKFERYSVEVVE